MQSLVILFHDNSHFLSDCNVNNIKEFVIY